MSDIDYSGLRSIADEPHWNEFVLTVGGELVSPLIKREGVKNADYIFRDPKIVMELKVLETEFAHTPGTLDKVSALIHEQATGSNRDFNKELVRIIKAPLQRIIKTANRQIRETKNELGLTGYRGVVVCVNDGFRRIRPRIAMQLLANVLSGESYRTIQCLIYLTNHYVEISENPGAVLLWAPMYSPDAEPGLVEFVDNLGRAWREYSNQKEGPYDFHEERSDIDWNRTYVVDGTVRHERYEEPKN